MERQIDIPQRLYKSIEQICKETGETPENYCIRVLREQIALDMYGDLNTKMESVTDPTAKEDEDKTSTITIKLAETHVESEELDSPIREIRVEPKTEEIVDVSGSTKEQYMELSNLIDKETEKKNTKHRILKTK